MNRDQKIVLLAGLSLLVLAVLFPPWEESAIVAHKDPRWNELYGGGSAYFEERVTPAGFAFLFARPGPGMTIAWASLGLEVVAVAAGTGIALLVLGLLKRGKKPEKQHGPHDTER